MSALEWGLLLLLSVLWGGTFYFAGVAVKELPPLTIVWCRVFLAAAALHLVLRAMGVRFPTDQATLLAFFGMGLLNNAIPFSLIFAGQREIASGLAAIFNATTPLFTVLVAHVLTADEKLSAPKVAGVIVGLGGVTVMVGLSALAGLGHSTGAELMVLAAAVSYAFAGIYGRRFKRMGVAPMATAAGQVTASTLILLPLVLAIDQPWTLAWPSNGVIAALAAMALLSTALAYIIYFRLLATAGATNLLLVTFLIPITAIVLGTWLLGETLETKHYVGMAAILAGLALIDGRIVDRLRRGGR
jgi:drug/metabolite transporter (DMT)-like permease